MATYGEQCSGDQPVCFLNASSVAVNPSWKSSVIYMPNMPSTKLKSGPKNKESNIERELMISQLSGTSFHLYRAIAEVIRSIGKIRIQMIIKTRPHSSPIDVERVAKETIYPFNEMDDFFNDDMTISELDYLVDPGVTGEPRVPMVVKSLPTSRQLMDAINLVLHDLQTAESIRKNPEISNDFEAMKMANNLDAERGGKVTAVLVSEGESVMEDTPLVVIE